MRSTPTRSIGLAVATIAWLALTAWVLSSPVPGRPAVGGDAAQEPPPTPGVWDRLSLEARKLWNGRPASPALEAVHQAMRPPGVPAWHQAGYRGRGVKVAVLDSGFALYREATGRVLPASLQVRSFRKDGQLDARESQHGVLCGEVIHHLAPEADMVLANWEPETPAAFLDAVRWARQQGARIISCSMIMPCWGDGEGGGPIHRALRELLGDGSRPDHALFFASAGNTAQRHWGGAIDAGPDGWHQWVKGKVDNALRPYVSERVSVELTSCGPAGYEVVLFDPASNREISRQRSTHSEGSSTVVLRFVPRSGQRYNLRLRRLPGNRGHQPEGRFHLTVLGGKLQHHVARGSIAFPGDGAAVVAVAAVSDKGRRLSYSSCGPLRHTAKPDLAAVVPFPSVWRPHQPFSGTSAAAPQAAALAALIWSRHPDWTAAQVRASLQQAAVRNNPGHNVETGHGLARLPR